MPLIAHRRRSGTSRLRLCTTTHHHHHHHHPELSSESVASASHSAQAQLRIETEFVMSDPPSPYRTRPMDPRNSDAANHRPAMPALLDGSVSSVKASRPRTRSTRLTRQWRCAPAIRSQDVGPEIGGALLPQLLRYSFFLALAWRQLLQETAVLCGDHSLHVL
ncbi:hypothetical protein CBS147326_2816 [Penicillium roqueforti]|nr:hypothetical protein CBS147326_2816 [Penicillium roqueforti]